MSRQFKRTMTHSSACISYLPGRVAVCCSALQCVAVCCSALQCVAVCCSVLQCVAVCCSVNDLLEGSHLVPAHSSWICQHVYCKILQHIAARYQALQRTETHYITLQRTTTRCNSYQYPLQHIATHCTALQHTASNLEVAVLTPAFDLTIRSKP